MGAEISKRGSPKTAQRYIGKKGHGGPAFKYRTARHRLHAFGNHFNEEQSTRLRAKSSGEKKPPMTSPKSGKL